MVDKQFRPVGQAVMVGIRPFGDPVEPHPGVGGDVRVLPCAPSTGQHQVRRPEVPIALQPVERRGHHRPDDVGGSHHIGLLVCPCDHRPRRGMPNRIGKYLGHIRPVGHRQPEVPVGQVLDVGDAKLFWSQTLEGNPIRL